ncbi:protein SDE2 homolog [Prunus yedoensis var. nudiflora]|uniref:Protein SDE2 homolog n=1 Tax=Prunus yedoensis var. nudiflora TaxID=2094558 RepID=A0A314XNG6_PRUYE|nr:protein SDE2 homolog [Prunus yedoensis var. nudiflora]
MGESDSDTEDNDSDNEDKKEKSVVLNSGNNSDSSKDAEGSLDSVTRRKQDGEISGGGWVRVALRKRKRLLCREHRVKNLFTVKRMTWLNHQWFFESNPRVREETVASGDAAEIEKPLNFDEFNSAAEMEVLGLERLKSELQAHGLKCGGTMQERAARLFMLKSTPIEKIPKKLLAKK